MTFYTALPWRGILEVSGPDRVSFLQGLLTNDLTKAPPPDDQGVAKGLWAALLTPQGKVLHEMFVVNSGEAILLDAEKSRLDDLMTRLKRYKLRAAVTLTPSPACRVWQVWGGDGAAIPTLHYRDPRHPLAGTRVIAEAFTGGGATQAPAEAWNLYRRRLGLADGAEDTGIEAHYALELAMHDLAGVDFHKGCYVGQETTARLKYRGLLKKRLMAVQITGDIPIAGSIITTEDGSDAGTFRAATTFAGETIGLAVMRLDMVGKGPFGGNGATVMVL